MVSLSAAMSVIEASLSVITSRREGAQTPVIRLNAKLRWIAGSSPAMTNGDVRGLVQQWASELDGAAFDLLAQVLHRFIDILEMRIDCKRATIGFERV